jgi:basic membrane protein A
MLKRVDTALIYGLTQVRNNTFKGESTLFDLKNDGLGYSAANSALTADIKGRLEQIKQQIVSGQITIAATNGEAKRLPGFPQDLRAVDN